MKSQSPSKKRRLRDIAALHRSGYLVDTQDDGTMICKLDGPADTPYENMHFSVRMTLPMEYPFRSPSVGFIERIFHPNVDYTSGTICLNVLNQEWTPVYNLVAILETLLPQLLTYPNPDDPLNDEAAQLLLKDAAEYRVRCRQSV
jgi:ubiquitin-conjugating enzyme E2 H